MDRVRGGGGSCRLSEEGAIFHRRASFRIRNGKFESSFVSCFWKLLRFIRRFDIAKF